MDFRQALFKYRSYTPIPFLLVMVIVAHPTFTSMIVGLGFVLIGEVIRLWGVSYAGSETRTTGQVGATVLVTTGPYSFVRNPLYLGNMMMYFGLGIMANTPLLAMIGLFYFFFQYTLIVSLEEESLFKKFPEEYLRYFQSVPRFIPTLRKYLDGNHPQPVVNWKNGINSERRTFQAIASVIILLIVIWFLRG